MSLIKTAFNVSRETYTNFIRRNKHMIELYTIILIILISTVTSSFFLGFMFGRTLALKHINDSIAKAEQYIDTLYANAPTYNHTFEGLPND